MDEMLVGRTTLYTRSISAACVSKLDGPFWKTIGMTLG